MGCGVYNKEVKKTVVPRNCTTPFHAIFAPGQILNLVQVEFNLSLRIDASYGFESLSLALFDELEFILFAKYNNFLWESMLIIGLI